MNNLNPMGLLHRIHFVAFFAICMFVPHCNAESVSPESAIGNHVDTFTLDNCYGKAVSLSDFEDVPAIAIVFLGTECPLAKLYGPRLTSIQKRYQDMGFQVIGINSNKQDSLTELAAYVHRHEIGFPMLKDVGNVLADAMGAKRTPEVFVLDADRNVRYHGRIDDQYGVGYSREREAQPEMTRAVDQILAGKDVSIPLTEAVGCHIGRVNTVEPIGDVTFNKHIAPILNAHCVKCHREGEIAPFTLSSYDDTLGWEDTILEVIEDKRMPPWTAAPSHHEYANDPRLSDEEKNLISTWVDNGMPQGDPNDLPPAPHFSVGWQIDEPDEVIEMQKTPYSVPAEGVVDYQYFTVDPEWKEDKYIVAAEARPDRRSVVHHILVYAIKKNGDKRDRRKVVAGYAPGSPPMNLRDGLALRVEKDSTLLFELHYTPNGSAQEDLSYLGLRFTDKENVTALLEGRAALDNEFVIPPNVSDHKVEATYNVRADEDLISMSPHMHLRGKSFKYEVSYPDGSSDVLLDVPNYDFNWQLKYIFKDPVRLPKGSTVSCTAIYDNSESNLTNPDPSVAVQWGDQSFNEMMIGFMDTVPVRK